MLGAARLGRNRAASILISSGRIPSERPFDPPKVGQKDCCAPAGPGEGNGEGGGGGGGERGEFGRGARRDVE